MGWSRWRAATMAGIASSALAGCGDTPVSSPTAGAPTPSPT